MARGFGATLGTATTDRLSLDSTLAGATPRTWSIFTWRNGEGGGSGGRVFEHGNGLTILLNNSGSTGKYIYQRKYSNTGDWRFTAPSASAWHHIVISHQADLNPPAVYVDGAAVSAPATVVPTGSADLTSTTVWLGNRNSDAARVWDGLLAEFSAWDAALDAGEALSLYGGVPPYQIRPTSLLLYLPILGRNSPEIEIWRSLRMTVTGALQADHPSVRRAKRRQISRSTATPTARLLLKRRRVSSC